MSGRADVATLVQDRFRNAQAKSVEELQRIVIETWTEYEESHMNYESTLEDELRGIGVVAAEYQNGETLVHTMQHADGYRVHTFTALANNTLRHTGGIFADEADALLKEQLAKGKEPALKSIMNVFEALSGKEVGGSMTVAMLNSQGARFLPDQPIKERLIEPYFEDFIQAYPSYLLGSTIRTAAYGERIVMDPYGFEFFDASNALRVTLGTNPSANISGHTYYNRYGQSQGLVYAIDDELHVMGTNNLRLGANYGETNMQGSVTFVSRDGVVKFKGVVDFSEATIIGL
ncbi:hypothetical protein [Paenibacillus lactis]|uniref:hypothetical protein n=1 Tax=Paenibacillus lactis TaxID=228574 RepID=UPI003675B753